MYEPFLRFCRNQSGATAIEYGLLAALIGIAIIAGANSVGTTLDAKYTAIGSRVGSGATTAP